MTTFRLPDLGEGLTESTILTWHVAEGDQVELNQLLADVETAKAVVELSSPYAGRVATLHAAEGETLPVGSPLIEVMTAEEESAEEESEEEEPVEEEPRGEEPTAADGAPDGADDDASVPRENEVDPSVDASDPSAAASPDRAEGPQRQAVLVGYGPVLSGGERPRRRPRSFTTVPFHGRPAEPPSQHQHPQAPQHTPAALPPVRRHARDLGVDLAAVQGSGPQGRILRADVDACAAGGTPTLGVRSDASAPRSPASESCSPASASTPAAAFAPTAPTAPSARSVHRASRLVPVTGLRRQTARAMVESATTAPQAAVFATLDVTATLKQVRRATAEGSPTSFLSAVCRAVILAAGRTPSANARFDAEAEQIEQFAQVALGVAVATERGLVVTTLPEAETATAPALTESIRGQAAKAREGTLTPAELTGSTLTVTNVGVFGVEGGIPLLNPGQSTIVALGAIQRRPWEHRGKVALRKVVTLTVGFDHRVLDGAEASAFLTDITDVLSAPQILLTR